MDSITVLGVQCGISLLVFFLIAKWYVVPKINSDTGLNILSLLLLVNVFRYLPLSLFMPGQISGDFPTYLKEIIAYGDLISGLLAMSTWLLIKSKSQGAIGLTWIFTVVSITDIVLVMTLAMREKVYNLPLGSNYFTVSVYVPMLIVIQVLILKILIHKKYQPF